MCPDIKIIETEKSIILIFDFTEAIDSVVSIEMKTESLVVKIQAHGVCEYALDAGFPLYSNDGSSFYFNKNVPIPENTPWLPAPKLFTFSYLQTSFIKICTESFRGIQMLESNPCLLWIMLDYSIKNSLDKMQIHSWLGMKRKDIIKIIIGINFDGDEKFISKIDPITGESNELNLIIRTIKNPQFASAYAHWSRIPIQVLYIAERYPTLHGAHYLLDWCSENHDRMSCYLPGSVELNKLTEDTIRAGKELNIKNSRNIVISCKTVDQLNKLHDAWVDSLNRSRRHYDPDIEFDRPDIQEHEGIKWISSANSLVYEGVEMGHCIATYVDKARSGKSIIFSVYYPERATLEITNRNGIFNIIEIKKERNKNVSEETVNYIREWLDQENKKRRSFHT
ncbi:PcfJ domain-containing protein [Thalassolituus hydrocarboniclasticus]|uniref:PcfJ domain-containing protein n=1 Tax=Thalassolituus hydrocarboniclasticus TaxID=2742796 RepID=A0ABY6AC57_9GAMM|nr:PcfJ domain-containing protein [Thalassolituus hydrocarboniclasticus]UXD88621.1 PcfJ domain-containing protein [Thalassolituus hydrocarboniclasticus]